MKQISADIGAYDPLIAPKINCRAVIPDHRTNMNIPNALDSTPGEWHPSAGPKVNTDFESIDSEDPFETVQCVYRDVEHPRWGMISSVHTMRDIRKVIYSV